MPLSKGEIRSRPKEKATLPKGTQWNTPSTIIYEYKNRLLFEEEWTVMNIDFFISSNIYFSVFSY